jgi:hypothetical protein
MLRICDPGMDIAFMCAELDQHRRNNGGTLNGTKFRILFGGAE